MEQLLGKDPHSALRGVGLVHVAGFFDHEIHGEDKLFPDFCKLEIERRVWEFSTVKTLTVDEHQRILIPDAKPRQVFVYENHGHGQLTLTLVDAVEPFPKGSLRQFITEEANEELSLLARSSSLELPE